MVEMYAQTCQKTQFVTLMSIIILQLIQISLDYAGVPNDLVGFIVTFDML